MATVRKIRDWLGSLPADAEFVVWGANGKEYVVHQVGHASDQERGDWTTAGVFLGAERPNARLRAVE